MNQYKEFLIIPVLIIIVFVITFFHEDKDTIEAPIATPSVPDFRYYTDVKKKKNDFFAFMLPMITQANKAVMAERLFVEGLTIEHNLSEQRSSEQHLSDLHRLAKKYKVKEIDGTKQTLLSAESKDKLLKRIDAVPVSLILAQSANESAWGTSRFARQANNFFGIWCFSKGCGITPLQRDEGLVHEVAKFDTVQDGVNYYIRMINTHSAYRTLRQIRATQREKGEVLSGTKLADGLIKYSERGEAYVQEIKAMIRTNKLAQYNG